MNFEMNVVETDCYHLSVMRVKNNVILVGFINVDGNRHLSNTPIDAVPDRTVFTANATVFFYEEMFSGFDYVLAAKVGRRYRYFGTVDPKSALILDLLVDQFSGLDIQEIEVPYLDCPLVICAQHLDLVFNFCGVDAEFTDTAFAAEWLGKTCLEYQMNVKTDFKSSLLTVVMCDRTFVVTPGAFGPIYSTVIPTVAEWLKSPRCDELFIRWICSSALVVEAVHGGDKRFWPLDGVDKMPQGSRKAAALKLRSIFPQKDTFTRDGWWWLTDPWSLLFSVVALGVDETLKPAVIRVTGLLRALMTNLAMGGFTEFLKPVTFKVQVPVYVLGKQVKQSAMKLLVPPKGGSDLAVCAIFLPILKQRYVA